MADVSVSLLKPDEESAWDAFVQSSAAGTFFHLAGWRHVIETAFGHRTYYLAAHRGGAIAGVLPLTHIKSLIFGNSLISNAFAVHGGVLAAEPDVHSALMEEAVRLGRQLKVDCIEIRAPATTNPTWVQRQGLYVTFRRPIEPDVEANMKAIPRKQRAMVRKGIANGLTSELDDDARRLHEIYARSVHHLGTPVFSLRYFDLLKRTFGRACDIVTVLHGTKPIASAMNFYFRDQVLPYYGGGTQDARALAGNDFLYWDVMRRACERGFRTFDFGRSKIGTGSYNFKRYWGFEPTPLVHEFLSLNGQPLPENNPLNPKFKLLVSTWQRLPFPLTKLIGPIIVRSIG